MSEAVGIDNHITGVDIVDYDEIDKKAAWLADHLGFTATRMTQEFRRVGLPIEIDASADAAALRSGDHEHFDELLGRHDEEGILHVPQIIALANITSAHIKEPQKDGLILGPLQGGKTTLGIALRFLGPVEALLTKKLHRPLYLVSNQKSHEQQAKRECSLFLARYGRLTIRNTRTDETTNLRSFQQQMPVFSRRRNLKSYQMDIEKLTRTMDFVALGVDDFIHRRSWSKKVFEGIVNTCGKIVNAGCIPILIWDEAHWGASDSTMDQNTGAMRRCVGGRIIDELQKNMDNRVMFIALSATPYGFIDATEAENNAWLVPLPVTVDPEGYSYCGFTHFGGRPIPVIGPGE